MAILRVADTLRTENLKNHTPFHSTYLYSPYMGVPRPGKNVMAQSIPSVPIPPQAFVILFWKSCKCPTLGPDGSYNNPTVGFKTVCKCLTSGPATPEFHFPVYKAAYRYYRKLMLHGINANR